MKRTTILAAVIVLSVLAAGAGAASHFVITNIGQVKPSVRAQLRGNQGPRGFTGAQGLAGPQGPTRRGRRVFRERPEHKDHRECQEHKDRRERQEHKDQPAALAPSRS